MKPLKRNQRKRFFPDKLQKFKGDARKTWSVIKILGTQNSQLSQLKLLSTKLTFLMKKIADEFDKFSTNTGKDLANKIPNASKRFYSYITKLMESQPL